MPQTEEHYLKISDELAGLRLDQALAKAFPDYSRSQIKNWIDAGLVNVNGVSQRPKYATVEGDSICMQAVLDASVSLEPQDVAFDVPYQDEDLLVVDKPAGCVVHPGAGNSDKTLANGLLFHFPELDRLPRAGLIHRLDKETSGLLIVARHQRAFQLLTKMMAERKISRSYLALCNGIVIAGGTVDEPIGRDPNNRLKMLIRSDGRQAVSHYRVHEKFRAHTLLDVKLETGRTHQIRVHMSHLGHPIVGDKRYGGKLVIPKQSIEGFREQLAALTRHALHAKALTFIHPLTDLNIELESPTPTALENLINIARLDLKNATDANR